MPGPQSLPLTGRAVTNDAVFASVRGMADTSAMLARTGWPAVENKLPPAHVSDMSTETASFDISVISPADASHALWIFAGGSAAIRPGIFTQHLMAAIAHADPVNRLILAAAFPGPAAAVALASRQTGGLDALTAIAVRNHSTGHAPGASDPADDTLSVRRDASIGRASPRLRERGRHGERQEAGSGRSR